MGKHAGSIDSLVLGRIAKMKPGNVFGPGDLQDLGSRTAVASALSRHRRAGRLTQPARGLYQVPEMHPGLGPILPTPDRIAAVLAKRYRLKLQPSGAYAANLLGLSDQVPQRIVYLTDGTPRQLQVGKQRIALRRTTPRNMATAGRIRGLVIQALRYLGQRNIDEMTIGRLSRRLTQAERNQLLKDVHLAPAWIGQVMRTIADTERAR